MTIIERNTSNSENTTGSSEQKSVVAVIPAYNEAESIDNVINSCREYVDEIIVVNDASADETEKVAREHADGVITHPKNMGVGAAVYTGYLAAIREEHDIVIQIDADGQHDASYIPDLLQTMEDEDADMVIGSRWLNNSHKEYSLVRQVGIKFFTIEANLIGDIDITDLTSGFRAYDVDMLSNLGRPENSHWALEQTLEAARNGYKIEETSVPMPPPGDGSQFDIKTFLSFPPRMVLVTLKVLLYR